MKGNSETFDVQPRDLNDVGAQSAPGDGDEGPVGVNAYSLVIVDVDLFKRSLKAPDTDTKTFGSNAVSAGSGVFLDLAKNPLLKDGCLQENQHTAHNAHAGGDQ